MADMQENQANADTNGVSAPAETPKVEVSIEGASDKPATVATPKPAAAAPKPAAATPKTEDLTQLTPQIVEALCFDSSSKTEEELRVHNTQLQSLLGKVIELLKEKSSLCGNLEKQNTALMLQSNSLKDVVGITKDLLSIRNMEVEHLQVDMKNMEEKINQERERHNNLLNRMSEAVKLNENLKAEYHKQLDLFNSLRARYEEKVDILEKENKQLLTFVNPSLLPKQQPAETQGEGQGEGGVELSLEKITP